MRCSIPLVVGCGWLTPKFFISSCYNTRSVEIVCMKQIVDTTQLCRQGQPPPPHNGIGQAQFFVKNRYLRVLS